MNVIRPSVSPAVHFLFGWYKYNTYEGLVIWPSFSLSVHFPIGWYEDNTFVLLVLNVCKRGKEVIKIVTLFWLFSCYFNASFISLNDFELKMYLCCSYEENLNYLNKKHEHVKMILPMYTVSEILQEETFYYEFS